MTEMQCIYDSDNTLIVKEKKEEEVKKAKYLSYVCAQDQLIQ